MTFLTDWELAQMRTAVQAVQLDMLCTIKRRSQTGTNPLGQPEYGFVNLLVDQPCHYWEEAENEMVGGVNTIVTSERIVLAANVGVTEDDIVSSVTGVDDTVLATNLSVKEVIRQLNWTLLAVQKVR